MGSSPHIAYAPRSGVTLEDEIKALAAVYAFVIRSHEEKRAAGPADKEGDEHGHVAGPYNGETTSVDQGTVA